MPSSSFSLFHALRVTEVRTEAEDAVVVGLEVPEELAARFAYRPGQFLTFRHMQDGTELRRSYSICDWGDPRTMRVGVRFVPGGVFSTWLHEHLRVGDSLDVMCPDGHFCLPSSGGGGTVAAATQHYLAIAGGSGITPIMALMKATLASDPQCYWTLIYGNRTLRSSMFVGDLSDLKDRYLTRVDLHFVFSREHTDLPLYSGRIDRQKIAEFLDRLIAPESIDAALICGPFAVNDEAEAALRAAGVPEERIHIERFGVPLEGDAQLHLPQEGDAPEAVVTIIRDGVARDIAFRAGQPSILEAARAEGMEMPFSCTSGVCSTCRARLLEGEVRMDRCFALEKADLAAGFILTCQAHPLTERVVLSFDQR
jgi:ring-1,2-phenylacetyl-CoA epoxidase subunit PaaE